MTTVAPRTPIGQASARKILRGRFRVFVDNLRIVARGDCTPDELHQLRISSRQAEAMLRLMRDPAESRDWRWLRRQVRRIRRGCNDLRDDDVLRHWLDKNHVEKDGLREKLDRQRRKRLPRFAKRVGRLLEKRRLRRSFGKLIKRSRPFRDASVANAIVARGLFGELAHFVQAIPGGTVEVDQLHRMRVAGKRLRYATEAVGEIVPTLDLLELLELLRAMQKQLGAIVDHEFRKTRLGKLNARLPSTLSEHPKDLVPAFDYWLQSQPLERILADATAELIGLMRGERRAMK